MDDLALHRHVQNIWAAQAFLIGLLDSEDLSVKAQADLNDVIQKVSDAGCAIGDFHGRLSL